MPRLSLYKPEKGLDYKFIDRQASEMFQAGGTDVYVHKYLGAQNDPSTATADKPTYANRDVTNIQDLLFLENRDGTYDTQIYRIRGIYNVQNIDFNLSQFGLFIDNDTLYMTVHINDFVKYIGRKPISGDVLELPHLRDDFALNSFDFSLPRYYVIEDVGRASEGFSSTWFPHLYRLRIKRITDNQKFASIFNEPAKDANGDPVANTTLRDLLSTYNQELNINDQNIAQAEADAPKSGYETRQFYTLAADPTNGKPILKTADETDILASSASANLNASATAGVPQRSGYTGYLLGDGYPDNGYEFGFGIQFPNNPQNNDFFLRTDFMPNRLFRFDAPSSTWVAYEDSVRMNMTNNDTRNTLKTSFINNTNYLYNEKLASDAVKLTANATVVPTHIPYNATTSSAKYVVLKFDITTLEYDLASYPNIYSSYQYTSPAGVVSTCLQINLPLIPTNVQVVDGAGAFQSYPPSTTQIQDGGTAGAGQPAVVLNDTNGQEVIPMTGIWTVTLYNNRDEQRQSISKVLKPRADF